jgi:hypothetical protein
LPELEEGTAIEETKGAVSEVTKAGANVTGRSAEATKGRGGGEGRHDGWCKRKYGGPILNIISVCRT